MMASETTCIVLGIGAAVAMSAAQLPEPPTEPCPPYRAYDVAFEHEGGGVADLTYYRPNYCEVSDDTD